MGNSNSSQAYLVERRRLHCDGRGVAKFRTCTTTGQPARPGYYKIICNVNMNEVHVKGVMCNDQVTGAEFYGKIYVPMTANTPYLKGFQGQFTAIPNRDVGFELWWMPLD
ncbi:hypothetical protein H2200_004466 [Cladophialophora chaetospira]|uniref:Uncharacterized protein n=1 Tax=Cladophialophora chaetospira TaxID=386627 RepID=A0AA39CK77_9EURO|nr:hypothetical protein H2200_004466 [Cladophialophora chaetospira]